MLVKSLIEKYPNVDAKLFIGGSTIGVNPKINNMHKAYEASLYDFVLISDSGIRSNLHEILFEINLFKYTIHFSERRHIARYDESYDR